jgi:hypothetical protein
MERPRILAKIACGRHLRRPSPARDRSFRRAALKVQQM